MEIVFLVLIGVGYFVGMALSKTDWATHLAILCAVCFLCWGLVEVFEHIRILEEQVQIIQIQQGIPAPPEWLPENPLG